ncbi:sigma factor-like helix-turn-helix DNA-binding protein [Mesorhizobium sp. B2-1-3]|uniref:sigma factor-like helix-turn-helix DNA-binding protein n=1 Tax=Mesorhizobium sp. B2-1-3 TaxID=2589972 RepID=UPI001FF0315E|nr:sigma factor-like helix-turn-helix DNA-binding protein [Mesorhizobium sp. B2-1-3]
MRDDGGELGRIIGQGQQAARDVEVAARQCEGLGISKERVRQIEARAMEKLKVALVKQNPEFLATAA